MPSAAWPAISRFARALALGARRRVERLDAVEVANRLDSLYASLG